MKIGDGGLQGMATHDDVASRQVQDKQSKKPDGTENLNKERGTSVQLDETVLNKAVEKLNQNARAHNLPLEFKIKQEDEKTFVEMKNKENGKSRQVQSQDLPGLIKGIVEKKGLIIDEYF